MNASELKLWKFISVSIAILALTVVAASTALAAPVVAPGGKPGVATRWEARGNSTVLDINEEFDASEVAAAIRQVFPESSVEADGKQVVVTGPSQSVLLKTLERIDVSPSVENVDGMLAALQMPNDASGSSIRATSAADLSESLGSSGAALAGRVIGVRRARFPVVVVTVKLDRVPEALRTQGLAPGQEISLTPRLRLVDGFIDPADTASQLNLSSWYVLAGDTVRFQLEAEKRDQFWIASVFDRASSP